MGRERGVDGFGIDLDRRNLATVAARESAAEIEEFQFDSVLRQLGEEMRRMADRLVPGMGLALLRADVERNPGRHEAEVPGFAQKDRRHGRIAAELARERPVGEFRVGENAAKHPRPRRRPRNLVEFAFAVECEQADAIAEGCRDRRLRLDRVAEGETIGRDSHREAALDLAFAGEIERGVEAGQARDEVFCRIGFHRIENARRGQAGPQAPILFRDDIEIDDEAGRGGPDLLQESERPVTRMTAGLGSGCSRLSGRPKCAHRISPARSLG